MVRPSPRVGAIVGKVTEPDVEGAEVITAVVEPAVVGAAVVDAGVEVASSPQATRPRQMSARSKTNFNFKLLLLSTASFSQTVVWAI